MRNKIILNVLKHIDITKILLLLAVVLIICVFSFSQNQMEGLANTYDCSKCQLSPTNGSCTTIYEIATNITPANIGQINASNIGNYDISIVDTGLKFCPWVSTCTDIPNMVSQSDRMNLTNDELSSARTNVTCCENSPWYNEKTYALSNVFDNLLKGKCENVDKIVETLNSGTLHNDYGTLGDSVIRAQEICNKIREEGQGQGPMQGQGQRKGMLFKSEMVSTPTNIISGTDRSSPNSNITQATYEYKPLKANKSSAELGYILRADQFFDCFGKVTEVTEISFNATQTADFDSDPYKYFDTGPGAPYTADADKYTMYKQDTANNLEQELKLLQNLPPGGNAPTSVITTYLTAINSFYEKQLQNMMKPSSMNPESMTPDNALQFDGIALETAKPTFMVYEKDPTNTYECLPSVTGNDLFKECGPVPY